MDSLDWVSIGSAFTAALALIANIFSAAGAARSANVAMSAERRLKETEALAEQRELRRTAAQAEVEADTTIQLCDLSIGTRKGLSTMVGHTGGSLEKEALERYEAWRSAAEDAKAHSQNLPMDSQQIRERQLALDEALIRVRSAKDSALRELDDMQRERHRVLANRAPVGRM
jgi:hypothetical protein